LTSEENLYLCVSKISGIFTAFQFRVSSLCAKDLNLDTFFIIKISFQEDLETLEQILIDE